jgi:hypothetical protein
MRQFDFAAPFGDVPWWRPFLCPAGFAASMRGTA